MSSRQFLLILALALPLAFATDITGCQNLTEAGTYDLTADIANDGNVTCFYINASNVILNCSGHTVDGKDTAGTYGALVVAENAIIENCLVSDWAIGVKLSSANYSTVTNSTIWSNANNSIFVLSSAGNNITNSIMENNTREGIFLSTSNSSSIRNNSIARNAYHGIYVLRSHYNSIEGNAITGHNVTGYASIYIHYSNYNNFTGNTADLGYFGIWCDYCNSTNVVNNTVLHHIREGVRFDSGLETVITIYNPNITGNYIDNSGYSTDNCVQFGTSVDGIVAHNQGYNCYDGYHIRGNSHNNTIWNNTGANFVNNGMDLQGVWNNTVIGNNMTNYSTSPLLLNAWYPNVNSTYCDNLVVNNTGDLGLPIYYSNETGAYSGGEYAYFALCGAPNSIIENITLTGLSSERRNSYMQVVFSENSVIRNVAITNSYAIGVADSNNCTASNISMSNTEWGVSVLWQNRTFIENVSISDILYSGLYIFASTNGTYRNFLMAGGDAHYGAIFLGNGTINLTDNTFHNVTAYSVPNYAYTYPVSVDVDNFFTSLKFCKGNPSADPAGCIEFDRVNITVANLTNNTNIILADDFVSINTSDGNASQFNSSANITLAADCSAGVLHSIYREENFSPSAADIVANGTLYTPTRMECAGDYITFGVTSFSGYALEEGTLNITFSPSAVVLPHMETNASCGSSDASVMLELYREDVLVANGTSHVEDVQTLDSGTYVYRCNTTNSSASYALGTLTVRAQGTGGSVSPLSVGVSGDEIVGNTLTITVRDGSTPISGADVRALYRINGILNSVELGTTDSHGQVGFVPAIAAEYTVEAAAGGYSGGELEFIVEAAGQEETVAGGQETGNTEPGTENPMPGTGCAGGCPAGYGCINVQCVQIGEPSTEGNQTGPGPILPVVASPAWEGGVEQAEREVGSTPRQAAGQPSPEDGPANAWVIAVPLVLAAAGIWVWRLRR